MSLEEYISRVDGFIEMPSSSQILYLSYYLMSIAGQSSFSTKDILVCFDILHLPPYSNVSAYLSRSAKQKEKRILKCKSGGYVLSRKVADEIARQINDVVPVAPSSSLFPWELFDHTRRKYIPKTARQVAISYDNQAYDACLVMIRRLLETLIIEVFEHFGVQDRIKNIKGHYLFCSDLIDQLISEKHLWVIGRNAVEGMKKIKTLGDLCAHNRRFNATKNDLDEIKLDLRVILEELIHLSEI